MSERDSRHPDTIDEVIDRLDGIISGPQSRGAASDTSRPSPVAGPDPLTSHRWASDGAGNPRYPFVSSWDILLSVVSVGMRSHSALC